MLLKTMKIEELMILPSLCSAIITATGFLTFSAFIFLFVRKIISIIMRPIIWAQMFYSFPINSVIKRIWRVSELKN